MQKQDLSKNVREISVDEVRLHLQRVLTSPAFRGSKRCHRFLAYVVGHVLEGKADNLKERTLAVEIFDRPDSFESGEDTIVRVGAREVRKRLAQYYTTPQGMQEKMRIELPPGSYVPEFVYPELLGTPATEALSPPVLVKARPERLRWIQILAITGIALIAAFLLRFSFKTTHVNAVDQFWAPLWESSEPVLIAIAHPLVYHPSSRAVRLNEGRLGPAPVPIQRPLRLLPKELDGSDMVPVPDQYVGYGDTAAAVAISALSARHSKNVRIRPASKLEFGDFREMPAVLIGAFTNRWTLELSQAFRFHFGQDSQGAPAIVDTTDKSHFWSIPLKQDNGSSPEDYFLVCRLLHSPSGKPVMIAAGLTQFGTEAAGGFLVDSERLRDTLQKIGSDWRTHNVEIVFHAKVIGNSPSASDLIAWYVW